MKMLKSSFCTFSDDRNENGPDYAFQPPLWHEFKLRNQEYYYAMNKDDSLYSSTILLL